MRWNPTNILHRMQIVVDTFLRYHGWGNRGNLQASPFTPDWRAAGSRAYQVQATLSKKELLLPQNSLVPVSGEIEQLEKALSWVLSALFSHAQALDLGYPPFW